jgi:chromate transporter
MVLAFVGFMAGYNHFENSVFMGTLGLLLTTFYTFLPCFLFIFIGAPIIERTHKNNNLKQILSIVTAAVVGVILNLTVYLGKVVLFPKDFAINGLDLSALAWTIISFIVLFRFKINIILWIGISAIFGVLRYYFLQ